MKVKSHKQALHTAIYNIIFTRRYFNPQYAIGRSETSITHIEMQVHKYKESQWEGRSRFIGRESRKRDRAPSGSQRRATSNTLPSEHDIYNRS